MPDCSGLAYYNEFDPAAAHVLEHLISEGVIAPGVVDRRSIKEVQPNDIKGFCQVHLFAGGGLWSVAARLAGWPDDRPLWTASCPCQPFSPAGKGEGTNDARHLWPDVYRLACALRPTVIMGEQVAGKAGYGWFDGVSADLAREGYTSRSVDFPACSIDAPHQRNRQYWIALLAGHDGERCAEAVGKSRNRQTPHGERAADWTEHLHGNDCRSQPVAAPDGGECVFVSDSDSAECPWERLSAGQIGQGDIDVDRADGSRESAAGNEGLHADASGERWGEGRSEHELRGGRRAATDSALRNGTYWSDAEWIVCHDGKARRAKPGLCFLAHGFSGGLDHRGNEGNEDVQEAAQVPYYGFLVKDMIGRVDLWRIGGNAIVPQAAAEVIAAFIDVYGLPPARETA